jgi:type I thyroxine 5'-deiodinase
MVYIAEAHASDVWQLAVNERQGVVFANPTTIEERNSLAVACVRDLGIEFPGVVDDFDNSTERKYTAWPDRLYLIDLSGRIAYKSAPGPYGFKPKQLEQALLEQLRPPG